MQAVGSVHTPSLSPVKANGVPPKDAVEPAGSRLSCAMPIGLSNPRVRSTEYETGTTERDRERAESIFIYLFAACAGLRNGTMCARSTSKTTRGQGRCTSRHERCLHNGYSGDCCLCGVFASGKRPQSHICSRAAARVRTSLDTPDQTRATLGRTVLLHERKQSTSRTAQDACTP